MVEIAVAEQNIEKRMKKNEDSLRDLWDRLTIPLSHYSGPRRKKEREKRPKK